MTELGGECISWPEGQCFCDMVAPGGPASSGALRPRLPSVAGPACTWTGIQSFPSPAVMARSVPRHRPAAPGPRALWGLRLKFVVQRTNVLPSRSRQGHQQTSCSLGSVLGQGHGAVGPPCRPVPADTLRWQRCRRGGVRGSGLIHLDGTYLSKGLGSGCRKDLEMVRKRPNAKRSRRFEPTVHQEDVQVAQGPGGHVRRSPGKCR